MNCEKNEKQIIDQAFFEVPENNHFEVPGNNYFEVPENNYFEVPENIYYWCDPVAWMGLLRRRRLPVGRAE